MLSQKEALASNMMANEEKMQEMRDKYEKSLASLQEELATLQQEKDKLDIQTKSSKNNDPTCKISEQRRKRIQDLENQASARKWNIHGLARLWYKWQFVDKLCTICPSFCLVFV